MKTEIEKIKIYRYYIKYNDQKSIILLVDSEETAKSRLREIEYPNEVIVSEVDILDTMVYYTTKRKEE